MSFPAFLRELFETGRATLGALAPLADEELAAAQQELVAWDRVCRDELPGAPHELPRYLEPAALRAATQVYRAAQLLVFRDLGAEVIAEVLEPDWLLDSTSPDVHYSVDLTLRFLPDLLRMVSVAADDPLIEVLRAWGRRWPLSSVGAEGLGPLLVEPPLSSAVLRRLYVDRVLAASDRSRLQDPRVLDAIREQLGAHLELAGPLAAALHRSDE